MESMINDPSFRDLVAKHFAEQMITKSLILPAAAAAEVPAAAAEVPAAAAPTLTIISSEAPRKPMEKALDYIPLPKLDTPLEIILSGKKRLADRSGSAASVSSFHEPLTARQLIQRALLTSDPVPYSICMKLNSLRSKLIPYLRGYTLDDLKSIHIDTFLTHIIPYCYDIFVERRLSPNKLGVKLIPFGLHHYKYPTSRTLSVKRNFGVDSILLDFIDNFAKEYIISTFLRIITDEENCRYYNYSVKVHPNWKKEITFCQIYSISGIDLDRVMERMFDASFTGI